MSLFDLLNPTNSSTTSESAPNSTVPTSFEVPDVYVNVMPQWDGFGQVPARTGTGEVGPVFEMESAVAREEVQIEISGGSHGYFEDFQKVDSQVEYAQADTDAMEVDCHNLPGVNTHEPAARTEESMNEASRTAADAPPVAVESVAEEERADRVKMEEEEMEVDIMGIEQASTPEQQHAPTPLRLQPLPRPVKATKAQRKASRIKGGKARAAMYNNSPNNPSSPLSTSNNNTPGTSPGPSGLHHEIGSDEGGSGGEEVDGSSRMKLEPSSIASTSALPSPSSVSSPLPFSSQITYYPTALPHIRLSSPFVSYTPPGAGVSESSDNEGNAAEDTAVTFNQRRKGKERVKEVEQVEEEGDDRLYCVCGTLYDPERSMIACDLCENWYHLDCVDILDVRVDLVDQFVCPPCEASTSSLTTWKGCCVRPTCLKPVASLSKYCSDYCGIEVAATRIELSGIDPELFWSKVVGARRKEGVVQDTNLASTFVPGPNSTDLYELFQKMEKEVIRREEENDERTLVGLEKKLEEIVTRKGIIEGNLFLTKARTRYLRLVIKRWEILCQATVDGIASEGIAGSDSKAKLKGKGGVSLSATSSQHALCGFDVRLCSDEQGWSTWIDSEEGRAVLGMEEEEDGEREIGMEEDIVCLRPKKRCDRHTGWQKVREADFEVEKAVLTRRLERLTTQERRVRLQIEDHEEASRFRIQTRDKIGVPFDVSAFMEQAPRPRTTPIKGGRAVGGSAGGLVVNGIVAPSIISGLVPPQPNFGASTTSSNGIVTSRISQRDGDEDESEAEEEIVENAGEKTEEGSNSYEVPDEVFAFLSRSEQQKLRGGRR